MATQTKLDISFEALADETRRSIVSRLTRASLPMGRLASQYKISRPAISQHVDVLEKAGFVVRRRKGRQVYVTLIPQALVPARKWLADLEQFWLQSFKRLNTHLIHKS